MCGRQSVAAMISSIEMGPPGGGGRGDDLILPAGRLANVGAARRFLTPFANDTRLSWLLGNSGHPFGPPELELCALDISRAVRTTLFPCE